MRRIGAVLIAFTLAGCGSQNAMNAQRLVVGRPLADLETCMGVPAHTLPDKPAKPGDVTLAQWETHDSGPGMSAPIGDLAVLPLALPFSLAGAGSVSMSTAHWCNAVATVKDGKVVGLAYPGATRGLSGRYAECGALVQECVRAWSR